MMSFPEILNFPEVAREAGFKMERITEGPFNWQPIGDVDVPHLLEEDSFEQIENVFGHLCMAPVGRMITSKILDPAITQYLEVSQLSVQYLIFCREFLTNRVYELDNERATACNDLANSEYSLAEANGEIEQLYARLSEVKSSGGGGGDADPRELPLKVAKLQHEMVRLRKRLSKAEREIKAYKKLRSSTNDQLAGVQQLWDYIGELSRDLEAWMQAQEARNCAAVAVLQTDVAEITATLEATNLEGAASLQDMERNLEKRLGEISSSTEVKMERLTLAMKNDCRVKIEGLEKAMKQWYAEQKRLETIEQDCVIWLDKVLKNVPEIGETSQTPIAEANVGQPKDEKRCRLGRLMQLMTKPQQKQLTAARNETKESRPDGLNYIYRLARSTVLDADKVKVARECLKPVTRSQEVMQSLCKN